MLAAYASDGAGLGALPPGADLAGALWVDLFRPTPEDAAAVARLGFPVPTLEDLLEIEVSNRIYRSGDTEVLTVVLPGIDADERRASGPVAFLIGRDRLVTVRHHAPRPFSTFPGRADRSGIGCATHHHVFLGLVEEIVARLADILEAVGTALDADSRRLYDAGARPGGRTAQLTETLHLVGREGETLARVRLGLLTMERALSAYGVDPHDAALAAHLKAQMRDLTALAVHADFLSGRIAHVTDVTMGMINLAQNRTINAISVVSAVFLPPTLVASVYGMNFPSMPALDSPRGFLVALVLMIGAAAATVAAFKWKGWL